MEIHMSQNYLDRYTTKGSSAVIKAWSFLPRKRNKVKCIAQRNKIHYKIIWTDTLQKSGTVMVKCKTTLKGIR